MSLLSVRHYVTYGETRRFRQYKVVQAKSELLAGGSVKVAYTTVSHHWTWKGANKAAHRLSRENGYTA